LQFHLFSGSWAVVYNREEKRLPVKKLEYLEGPQEVPDIYQGEEV